MINNISLVLFYFLNVVPFLFLLNIKLLVNIMDMYKKLNKLLIIYIIMQQYTIPLKSYQLVCVKLDTNEFEFSIHHNYIEYYGTSYFKKLSFITDLQSYFNDNIKKITVELIDVKYFMIQFPVPYTTDFELVQLKIVEIDEFKKLNIMILKNSDDIKDQINSLKAKADKSIDTILKKQLVVNNEIKNRISKIEDDFKKISDRLSDLEEQINNKKIYRISASFAGDKITSQYLYISKEHDIRICNYLKKHINKYFHNLTNQLEYDIKNNIELGLKALISNYCNNTHIAYLNRFITLLANMNFKLTNNCILTNTSIYIEYVYDKKIKSVEVVYTFQYEFSDNMDVIHINSGGAQYTSISVIYHY
jgi:hypothetical protein